MSTPLLTLENVHFTYKEGGPVLKDISFTLERGQSLGIIGPNGGGKSTLLKLIIGLHSPTQGRILYKGVPLSHGRSHDLGIFAYVPQHSSLNSLMPLRVWDLLELGAQGFGRAPRVGEVEPGKRLTRSQLREEGEQILSLVGLLHKKDQLVSSLSGGEKQRALIAKALIQHPLILVLDEPHTGLDSTGQDQIFKILDKIKREQGTSILVVDHNLNLVIQHCDLLLCLNKGLHWHDHKKMLTKKILESIYHCEFEHLLIHESGSQEQDHHFCEGEYLSKGHHHHPERGDI